MSNPPEGSEEALPLPPVSVVFKYLIRDVMNLFKEDEGIPEALDAKVVRQRLLKLPRHTLEYISSRRDPWLSNPYLDRILISALHNEVPAVVIDDLAYLYLNMSYDITGYATWSIRGFEGEMILSDALRGVHASKLEGVDYDFQSDAPLRLRGDERGSKIIAILNVTNLLLDEFPDERLVQHDDKELADIITDRVLAQLVVDTHESNEELVEFMESRKTVDPVVLSSILNADATAMRDGFL